MLFVLFVSSLIVFYLGRGTLPPSYAVSQYLTPRMTPSQELIVAQSLGVATRSCSSWQAFTSGYKGCVVPLWEQYFTWLRNALAGNWGYSLLPGVSSGTTTWDVFWSRFPYTAELATGGTVVTMILAFPIGVASAMYHNKLPDHISRVVALIGYSLPVFWLGFVLQLVFGLYVSVRHGAFSIGLLPISGALATNCALCIPNPGTIHSITGIPLIDAALSGNFAYFWDSLLALILPSITLAFAGFGALARIVRSSVVEVLRQDYIVLARSKGLSQRVVIYRHALRNAMLPSLTVAGLLFGFLFGGAIIVEDIFSWPGVGQAALSATYVLDINFLELYVLVTATILVLVNLATDILYALIDPRIKY